MNHKFVFTSLFLFLISQLILGCSHKVAYEEYFTITDLQPIGNDDPEIKEIVALRYLGTDIKLNIYDNMAIFSYLRDPDRKFVLDKIEENKFQWVGSDLDNPTETIDGFTEVKWEINLKVNKSLGAVKNIEIISLKNGEGGVIKAKRK